MARTFLFSLDISGHRIRDITLNWGLRPVSDVRSNTPTYGTDIEVPAVIELLDLIASGIATAEEARDTLNDLAATINREQDHEYKRALETMDRAYANGQQSAQVSERQDDRWVYVVSSEDNPKVVKIGVAGNIERRIKNLQVGAPTQIILRWSARGGLPLESHLHETFRRRRMSGEWFDFRKVSNPTKAIEEAARVFLHAMDSVD